MYQTIVVTLDTSPSDRAIIDHVKRLAKFCSSRVTLLHVADGWAARQFGQDAVSAEITEDTAYLQQIKAEFDAAAIPTTARLLYGEPKKAILKWVQENNCDLIAMGTHGHRFLGDLFLGATATHIQHRVDVPMLHIRKREG